MKKLFLLLVIVFFSLSFSDYTFARGWCFWAGTKILTPTGEKNIEMLHWWDLITSYNIKTWIQETSTLQDVQVIEREDYYIINNSTIVTAEHPFYVKKNWVLLLKEVHNLQIGDILLSSNLSEMPISQIEHKKWTLTVYNLIEVSPNHNYFANGFLVHNKGWCFWAGTKILTPNWEIEIENLHTGDQIISYNFEKQKKEISTIGDIQIIEREAYYIINNSMQVTAEHPFYVKKWNALEIVEVADLKVWDSVYSKEGVYKSIYSIDKVNVPLTVYNLLNISPNHNYFANGILVHNKGWCFWAGTKILTPNWEIKIENLHIWDQIISYNFEKQEKEISTIGDKEVLKRNNYYLINKKTKVTWEHPFFVIEKNVFIEKEAQNLQVWDTLFTSDTNTIEVKSIEKIDTPLTVYNLIDISPNHNYFADWILVHNKWWSSSSSSKPSPACTVGGPSYNKTQCDRENFFTMVIIWLIMGVIFFANFFSKLYYTYIKTSFTNEEDIIDFTKSVTPLFENKYGSYSVNTEVRRKKEVKNELSEMEYSDIIEKSDLIKKVTNMFFQYQNDWMKKDFSQMRSYTTENFYTHQKNIFDEDFEDGWDIVYKPEVESVTPQKLVQNQETWEKVITCQINASMVNFSLDSQGKVNSGNDTRKSFTEYWSFQISSSKTFVLTNIRQI